MTLDFSFRGAMIAIAAIFAFRVIRALHTGHLRGADRANTRAEAPLSYWRELGLVSFQALLAVAAAFFYPAPTERVPYPAYGVAIFSILLVPEVIRMVWIGEVTFGSNNRWGRRDSPYWVILLIGLACVAFMGVVLIRDLSGG